ncbi:VOC family protein [Pseudonocardia sp. TRM90224]|uniref:VOC family protein n=1 Tax=Pseudonocardia sp. TRM90224 TaxID=2812678 RepID=UPI001E53D477|nr:VOC family protein [Pseudonocardia sp. TRM90224]
MPELEKLSPFLMYQNGEAEEAMQFYTSLFDDGEIVLIERFEPGQGPEGKIRTGVIRIAGRQVRLFDSPVQHEWDFTPGVSLFVRCGSREELDKLWAALSEGGRAHMPLDDYGFGGPFGFTEDRYGVSWQLIFES